MRGRRIGFPELGFVLALASTPIFLLNGQALAAVPQNTQPNIVNKVQVEADGGRTVIRVHGSTTPSFTAYRLDQPQRLVVDLAHGRLQALERQILADTWAVSQISLDERVGNATRVTRVLIGLKRSATYTVRPDGTDLVITILAEESPPAQVSVQGERERQAEELLRKVVEERKRTSAELTRLEQLRVDLAERERELAVKLVRPLPKPGQVSDPAAEEAVQKAREQQRIEEERLKGLLAARTQAEAQLKELGKVYSAQQAEETRLLHVQKLRKEEEQAERRAQAQRVQAERALAEATEQRRLTEQEISRLQARLSETEAQKGSQLSAINREVSEAQKQASALKSELQAAQNALKKAEEDRRKAEDAKKLEEERLAELKKTREQAELERQRQDSAQRAQMLQIGQAQQRIEGERLALVKSLEAQLLELQRARKQAASERQVEETLLRQLQAQRRQAEETLRGLEQKRELESRKLAVVKEQPSAPVPKDNKLPIVVAAPSIRPATIEDGFPTTAQTPFYRPSVTLRAQPLDETSPYPSQPEPMVRRPSPETLQKTAPSADRQVRPLAPNTPIEVLDLRFEDDGRAGRVIVEMGAPGVNTTTYTDSRSAVLRLNGANLPQKLTRTMDARAYGGPVESVSSFPDPRVRSAVRVVVALGKPVSPTLHRSGTRISWEFPRERQAVKVYSAPRVAWFGNVSLPLQVTGPRAPITAGRKFRRYEGRRIDLDFKDADIHNILRLLSDVGQVNIITTDDVKGTVTIRMRDVPWDQALDVVLKAKGLGSVKEGNLIRVAPQSVLDKEAELEAARLKNRVELAPIETRLIPLSYAEASKMSARVSDVLSPRGKVSTDERTNVLIISDMAANIALAEDLIRNLDTQIPQVLIEARIVEARATFIRSIGIQWGGGYTASPQTGNATGLTFPATVGVGGGSVDGNTNKDSTNGLGPNATNPQYAVNLPAAAGTGSGGALGIALGSLGGQLNINLRLSALENTGNIRVISAPKIITTDNHEASIEQGVSIPVSVVSAAGANTQFFDAKLNLTVKPHVTNDGSVVMDVRVTRNEPDFSSPGSRGDPSILKREAKTHMLVRDGDTAVIGGIYTRNTAQSYQKVPLLADIPIIGWLFKNRRDNDDRNELLIFITPRIINRPNAAQGSNGGGASVPR